MPQTTNPIAVREIKRIDKFVLVTYAGAGTFSTVDFCVAQEDITKACKDSPDNDVQEITRRLRNKLIVIKQSKTSDMKYLGNKVTTMQSISDMQDLQDLDNEATTVEMERISDTHHIGNEVTTMERIADISNTTSSTQSHFFQLLCFNLDARSSWMATTTFPICYSLEHLTNWEEMPEDFLWIIYAQLHGAIEFLYKTCKPPIGHGDVQSHNIIIGYPDVVPLGLPQVRLIDFGLSKQSDEPISEAERMEDDYRDLVNILYEIIDKRLYGKRLMKSEKPNQPEPEEDQPKYGQFRNAIVEQLVRFSKLLGSGEMSNKSLASFPRFCADLWEQFGSYATERVASVSEASKKKMQEIIVRNFATQQEKIEKELDKIIRANLQPPSE